MMRSFTRRKAAPAERTVLLFQPPTRAALTSGLLALSAVPTRATAAGNPESAGLQLAVHTAALRRTTSQWRRGTLDWIAHPLQLGRILWVPGPTLLLPAMLPTYAPASSAASTNQPSSPTKAREGFLYRCSQDGNFVLQFGAAGYRCTITGRMGGTIPAPGLLLRRWLPALSSGGLEDRGYASPRLHSGGTLCATIACRVAQQDLTPGAISAPDGGPEPNQPQPAPDYAAQALLPGRTLSEFLSHWGLDESRPIAVLRQPRKNDSG